MNKKNTAPTLLKITSLRPFKGHPYKVQDNEGMDALAESIKENGILTPLIVRPIENAGEYEIISGHRRLHAAQKSGITEVPALIYALDRDAAAIAVVDSNLHREHILPSEKAFAYRMKAEALNHQGKRTDLTLGQVVPKSEDNRTTAKIGAVTNESYKTVQRYIRLTYLIPEFLEKMDNGEIALSVGVELSYLNESRQQDVLEQCKMNDCTPSYKKAFEKNAEGLLSDEGFLQVTHEYDEEQLALKTKIPQLRERIAESERRSANKDKFIAAIRRFMQMDKLTAPLLRELIDRIEVYETQGVGKNRTQKIVIHYRFVGYIDIPEAPLTEHYVAETRQGVAVEYILA